MTDGIRSGVVGIDLGTSNCALALAGPVPAPVEGSAGEARGASAQAEGGNGTGLEVRALPITQVLGPSRLGEAPTFASALFFPHPSQFPPKSLDLPWEGSNPPGTRPGEDPSWTGTASLAGNFAREAGAQSPDRLVSSAKSWLSYRAVDPTRPLLPFGSDAGAKVSPLAASRLYLEHLRRSLAFAGHPVEEMAAVITVPASFDEVARKLTARAAEEAGFKNPLLLEEPMAAFYAWLEAVGSQWRDQVKPGDLVLVCDVGGGTTDFSLIAVTEKEGNLDLERIRVGRHILLGGDNMDLALAYVLRGRLEEAGRNLDDWQFQALVQAARLGKERLFEDPSLAEVPLAIPSRGSGLFAGSLSTPLSRNLLEEVLVEGFFALCGREDFPAAAPAAGLRELGLPYESDPVVSKHLAAFLKGDAPAAVLFNGGVFRAEALRRRVLQLLRSWSPGKTVRELEGGDPDLAVAKGAAVYGYNKRTGRGHRIRAGASRSYYIGLEPTLPAIPGYKPPIKALCIVPLGMEEGTEEVLEDREFGLATGMTATFRFFGSPSRPQDRVGSVVAQAEKELEETARLQMEVPQIEGTGEGTMVPVKLHARLSELGTLELWMQRLDAEGRFELQFDVRTR